MSYDPRACGAQCDICPLQGQKPIPPAIFDNSLPVLFVADAPGPAEVQKGQINAAHLGQKLDFMLRQLGASTPNKSRMRHTFAILCRPEVPNLTGKRRFETKSYMAWLRKENVARKKLLNAPLVSPFEACLPRLQNEIADTISAAEKQKLHFVIIPTGDFALTSVTGKQRKGSIMKWRGSVLPVKAS